MCGFLESEKIKLEANDKQRETKSDKARAREEAISVCTVRHTRGFFFFFFSSVRRFLITGPKQLREKRVLLATRRTRPPGTTAAIPSTQKLKPTPKYRRDSKIQ